MRDNPKKIVGDTKPPLHLIPPQSLIYLSMAMKDGAYESGYGPYNWRDDPIYMSTYYSASGRHWMAALDGEWIDPKSKIPHLAHAMASAAIVLDAHENDALLDPKYKQGNAAELIRKLTLK